MKKRRNYLGMLALIIIFAFSITGCGTGVSFNTDSLEKDIDDTYQSIKDDYSSYDADDSDDSDFDDSDEEEPETKAKKKAKKVKKKKVKKSSNTSFKKALRAYEKFVDEYVDFMKKYKDNPTDLDMISDYSDMLSRLQEYEEQMEGLKEELDMDDLIYYNKVMSRVSKKLLSIQ